MFWYEVFDDERVQLRVRRRAARQVLGLVVALAALGCAGVLLASAWSSWFAPLGLVGLLGLAVVAMAATSLARLRGVVWCVKLAEDHIVGYDHARRRVAMEWTDVELVDITDGALIVLGRPSGARVPSLHVPTHFADFSALSHRITRYAERHAVPICVEGRPWQLLDVKQLFPFLEQRAPAVTVRTPDDDGA